MSNMVVNTNIMALNSHRSLKGVGNAQSKASSRLSSGLRINSAADDAAGLAISEKMRAQIRGLDMASRNAQDAISLVQTAEGGMQEIDNMLQRIRELTVQASNDTNDQASGDRTKIQDEITQLVAEIDSMAGRVEFNKKKVIDGSFSDGTQQPLAAITSYQTTSSSGAVTETPVDKAKRLLSEIVNGADYAALANPAESTTATDANAYLAALQAALADPTSVTNWDNLMNITGGGVAEDLNNTVTAVPTADADSKIALDNIIAALADVKAAMAPKAPTLAEAVDGLTGNSANMTASLQAVATDATFIAALGANASVQTAWDNLLAATTEAGIASAWTAFTNTLDADAPTEAAALYSDTTAMGFVGQLLADKLDAAADSVAPGVGAGKLFFQVGANADQKLELNINSVKSFALGLADSAGNVIIDVNKATGADITNLLKGLDEAISYVTTERSKLGAVQNRLEYTIKSLDISSENLSASESRIRDTDMAKEMMNFTKANVLQQAATSMLAQANQAPQMILKLLG